MEGGDYAYKGVSCPDGGYLFCGSTRTYGTGSNNEPDAYVVKVDSIGNYKWQQTYGGNQNDLWNDMMKLDDSTVVLAGVVVFQGKEMGVMRKMTCSGNVLWTKKYAGLQDTSHSIYAVDTAMNGELVAMGTKTDPDNGYWNGFMVQTDQQGNMRWEKSIIKRQNQYAYLNNFIPTEDSGYLATGFVNPGSTNNDQDLWIVKLDSMGCDTPNCPVSIVSAPALPPSSNGEKIDLFPNPSQGRINLKLPPSLMGEELLFEVLNAHGRLVESTELEPQHGTFTMELKGLPKGLYLLRVSNGKGKERVVKFTLH